MPQVTKPDMNYGVWAENGNIEIPSSEKVEEGWVIEKPLNEQMNWLQNRSDRMLQYINQRGIPEWDTRTEYPVNAVAARSGVIYKSLSANTDKDPTLNTGIWEIAFVSYSDFINYSETVNNITGKDEFLTYYVSKANPIMTGAARGLSYNNEDVSAGLGFINGVAAIHKGLTTVAEFSGGTNPKDVVTHEQLALAIQNYKVGDIYTTTADGNPSTRLGYGTWSRFAKGRTLVGFSDEVSNSIPEWVKINAREYGSYTHKLTKDETPNHKHSTDSAFNKFSAKGSDASLGTQGSGDYNNSNVELATGDFRDSDWLRATEVSVGGDLPHNNVQPSIVVYFWKRLT